MKISACYIVKNEAKTLARSIRSLRGQADELIVVDTGSSDGTQGIAAGYGARVISTKWQDDFSAPRNLALEQATGDWIVFLDGDEYFTEETKGNLRRVIKAQQEKGTRGILMRRLDIDADKGNEIQADTFVLRVFRRDARLHYQGRIHEELREMGQPVQGLYLAKETELLLLHTGYSAAQSREKAERNLRLLLMELEQGEAPERIYGYLADAYLGVEDKEQAERYARLDVAQGRRATTYASRSYRILLELLAADGARVSDRLRTARDAARDFPEIPEFHADFAECLALQGDYRGAVEEMRRALEVYHGPRSLEPTLFHEGLERLARERVKLWEQKLRSGSAEEKQEQARRGRYGMKIKISACVIVKNEEKNLPRWLAQMSELADEMIVVDTGSEDRTVELAVAAGARVFHFSWCNDFSAAKNYALDQATGDWVFFLDADEYFAEETVPRVRPYLEQIHLQWKIGGLLSPWINIDPERDNLVVLTGHQVRIFRNEKELRYVGRIHEALDNHGKKKGMREFRMTDLVIYHTGYTVSNSKQKCRRNLEILLEDVERNGGERPEQYTYFVDCYLGLDDYEKTIHYAKLAIENEGAGGQVGQLRPNYFRMFDALHLGKYPEEEQRRAFQECAEKHPLWPEPYWYLGRLYLAQKQYAQAKEALQKMLELAECQKSDPEIYLQNSEADQLIPSARAMLEEIAVAEKKGAEREQEAKTPTHAKHNKTATELTMEMNRLYDAHDLKGALRCADEILALRPRQRSIVEDVLSLYLDNDEKERGMQALSFLLEHFPLTGYSYGLLARMEFVMDDYEAGIRHAERAFAMRDMESWQQALVSNILGRMYRTIGEVQKTCEHYLVASRSEQSAHRIVDYSNYLFNLHYLDVSRDELYEAAKGYQKFFAGVKQYQHERKNRHVKLRVGYVSPDLRYHVVAFFSYALLKSYDKHRFEVYCYAKGPEDDASREFAAEVDVWRNVQYDSHEQIAAKVYADEIDILMDLSGHTADSCLPVLAYRPAPIQICGIGWFDTTGLAEVDYFLADIYTDPPGLNDAYFTEKLLRLPASHFCYMWHDRPEECAPASCRKKNYITFGSFNNFAKTTDAVLRAWSEILRRVPDAQLLLKTQVFDNAYGKKKALARMEAMGLPLDRVHVEGYSKNYLQVYADIDIALDTYPYPGGGTTCDALYMGVPVITLVGERHNSRFGYSILMNMGLPELCTYSWEEYIDCAVALANDRERIVHFHQTLRRRMLRSPVMDARLYMAEVECAYERIWQEWLYEGRTQEWMRDMQEWAAGLFSCVQAEKWISAVLLGGKIAAHPQKDGKLYLALGKAYAELGGMSQSRNWQRASYWLEEAEKQGVREAEPYLLLSRARHAMLDFVGEYESAQKSLGASKEQERDFLAQAYCRCAASAMQLGYAEEAFEAYDKAWQMADDLESRTGLYSSMLLTAHYLKMSSEELFALHRGYGALFGDARPYSHEGRKKESGEKIRIGYLSPDFRMHVMFAVAYGMLSCYDRACFEVICYSMNEQEDGFTEHIKGMVDGFVPVHALDYAEIAAKIREDEIDILVDLAGHSSGSGLPVLAWKPAPVQVSGLGYLATTGLPAVDYYLTDEFVDPPGQHERFFTEKLLYLPSQFCYTGRDDVPEPKGAPCRERGYVLFGVFHRYRKITDEMLGAWLAILERVPGSRLLLKSQELVGGTLLDAAWDRMHRMGFDMDRVLMEPATSDYMERYLDVDIALDTYPYPGGGMTLDALYMGVPTVTLYGERRNTRFGLGILSNLGLTELAAASLEEYIARAVGLAQDAELLDILHKNLRGMLKNSAMEPRRYVRVLEKQYRRIWQEAQQ